MNARAKDLLRRAEQVHALVEELVAIRARCLRLGLALAPQIDVLVGQLTSEMKWCSGEANRRENVG